MNPNLLMAAEWRGVAELNGLLMQPIYYGHGVPAGDGKPIFLIPGFMWGDWSLALLAGWLRRIGYRPGLSGLDVNLRCPRVVADSLVRSVERAARAGGQKVVLVGHSKGGYIARYLALVRPDLVSHVVALGAPYRDPLDTNWMVRGWLELTKVWARTVHPGDATDPACCGVACPCGFGRALQGPLPAGVSFTAIFTRSDGVARWTNCLDAAGGRNIEVPGSHAGLPVSAAVYRELATLLRAIPVQRLPAAARPPAPDA